MRGNLKINAFQLCVWGHAMAHTYSEIHFHKELHLVLKPQQSHVVCIMGCAWINLGN